MTDLKPVYRATSKEAAETALDELEEKWGATYPIAIKSCRWKLEHLSTYFKYPEPIRKTINTTNAVEDVHRQFRKLTKTKGAFPNENSLLKLLYAGILNASAKWTMPIQNWSQALSQLDIYFESRLDGVLEIYINLTQNFERSQWHRLSGTNRLDFLHFQRHSCV